MLKFGNIYKVIIRKLLNTKNGPSDWNRTSGLLNPIQARYQSAPHPDFDINKFYNMIAVVSRTMRGSA